ncbi:hypothetical protein lerEdw1_010101 [Lerista edwardsae]|nr:hypothetical protein lerEdw1_010101 [Lerista edwardsae]
MPFPLWGSQRVPHLTNVLLILMVLWLTLARRHQRPCFYADLIEVKNKSGRVDRYCVDSYDKFDKHLVGSKWITKHCMSCQCSKYGRKCCTRYGRVVVPGCIAVLDPDTCKFTLYEEEDSRRLCAFQRLFNTNIELRRGAKQFLTQKHNVLLILMVLWLTLALGRRCSHDPYLIQVRHGGHVRQYCIDKFDNSKYLVGSKWNTEHCLNCQCSKNGRKCCTRYGGFVDVPGCIAVGDPKTCKYKLFDEEDPTKLCSFKVYGTRFVSFKYEYLNNSAIL